MPEHASRESFLAEAWVAPEVFALRPDYRALLLTADGLVTAPGDATTEALLTRAERLARTALEQSPVDQLPHIAAWRDAYRSFGAKPQRTRNSAEALTRRAAAGLPRVNRLTDLYNAISVIHQLPVGGEDLSHYVGSPRLIRAVGGEPFGTWVDGEPAIEYAERGEVVWTDDLGITCRRWNWRQTPRTQLTGATTSALFILDVLDPFTDDALNAVADELAEHLDRLGPDVRMTRRVLRAAEPSAGD